MGNNIHALRVRFGRDTIKLHALAENRRGSRYLKYGVSVDVKGMGKGARRNAVDKAIATLLSPPGTVS